MKAKILLPLLMLSYVFAFGQRDMYWVKFKDKNLNPHSLSNPEVFLSEKSIERREKQNISLNESDLPLTPSYVDSTVLFADRLVHRLKWSNTIVVQVSDSTRVDAIKALSFVDTVASIAFNPSHRAKMEEKFAAVIPTDQSIVYPNQYGVAYRQANMLNTDLLHYTGHRGEGITIAVMDNGFSNVNNVRGYDSVRSRILGTWDFVNNEQNVYNDGGHGANVLSCMAANLPDRFLGTAPDASYYLFTTEDNTAEWMMEEYNWAAAAEFADSLGVDVFTTSLGYTTFNGDTGNHTYADLNGHGTVITNAANTAFGKGILVINSAGNEGSSTWYHISAPADGDSVLAIGAVDSAGMIANFSGRGPNFSGHIKPDVCAMGVRSAVLTTAGDIGTSGGTSFSCPILAGSAASLWSAFPDKSAREIYDAIVISADRFWTPGNEYGYGIPNFYNAYILLKTNYDEKHILRTNDEVLVYPNPFTEQLFLSFYGAGDRTLKIEIFDLLGRSVYQRSYFVRNHTFEVLELELPKALQQGEYILRLDGEKQSSISLLKFK